MLYPFLVLLARKYHTASINPIYKAACGQTTKPTTLLFGDDMAKTMQEVKAINQITHKLLLGLHVELSFHAVPSPPLSRLLFYRSGGGPQRQGKSTFIQVPREEIYKNWKM